MYVYFYIYTEREGETYIYIYIYMYREGEREREKVHGPLRRPGSRSRRSRSVEKGLYCMLHIVIPVYIRLYTVVLFVYMLFVCVLLYRCL